MTKQSLHYTMASWLLQCVNKILLHFCVMRRVSDWAFGFLWDSLAFKGVAVSISFTLTKTQTGTPHHRQECRICVHAVPTGKKSTVEGWSPFAKPFLKDLRFNMHLGSCKYVTELNRFSQMKVVHTHLLPMELLRMSESTFPPNLLWFMDKPRTYELMRLATAAPAAYCSQS